MPIDCNDSRGFPHKDFAVLAEIFFDHPPKGLRSLVVRRIVERPQARRHHSCLLDRRGWMFLDVADLSRRYLGEHEVVALQRSLEDGARVAL